MDLLQVDQERCNRCGLCGRVCPTNVIKLGNQGPEAVNSACIACGHCVAVCPQAALDNAKAPLANQLPLAEEKIFDAETAACFLRSRRSIRCYKNETVPRDKIVNMLNIARLAPSGGNSQGVSYHVIDNPEILRKITAVTVDWMEEQMHQGSSWGKYFAGLVDLFRSTGQDVILRNAPCLVIAMTNKRVLAGGRDNTRFSLAYAELYAPSLGLGTCWAGFFEACATSGYKPLLDILDLPKAMGITGGIMVGIPQYSYKRLVDRNPLQITWR